MSRPYLFTVGPKTPPALEIDPGEEISLEVRGAFSDVADIRKIPTPFTPEIQGHPLTPVSGPVYVRGAKPGDSVVVELLEITPKEGDGVTAVLNYWGCLREEFREPSVMACPVKDGQAWFGGRIPIPLVPNLGTVSTMPAPGGDPSLSGSHGGDLDQKDVRTGSRIHLAVNVPGAMVFFADPHACISDGLISGIGIECTVDMRARIHLRPGVPVERPLIEVDDTLQFVGVGDTPQKAIEDAARHAVREVAARTGLSPVEAYMLVSAVGELRSWSTPRPIMAARLIVPCSILRHG